MKTKTKEKPIVRVIVEKCGKCIINSPVNPPATRKEVESLQWGRGLQMFDYDEFGVVIVTVA